MTKREARQYYRVLRSNVSRSQLEKWKDLILIRFQQADIPFLQTIHTYVPIAAQNEPDPEPLVRYLMFANPGLQVAVPRVVDGTNMEHVLIDEETTWIRNALGIPEPSGGQLILPSQIDLVFVPLLAFDRQGNRVGYGKGYYDRFLAQCRPAVVKVGLSFYGPLEQITDPAKWDIPLDYCITPEQVYEF